MSGTNIIEDVQHLCGMVHSGYQRLKYENITLTFSISRLFREGADDDVMRPVCDHSWLRHRCSGSIPNDFQNVMPVKLMMRYHHHTPYTKPPPHGMHRNHHNTPCNKTPTICHTSKPPTHAIHQNHHHTYTKITARHTPKLPLYDIHQNPHNMPYTKTTTIHQNSHHTTYTKPPTPPPPPPPPPQPPLHHLS
ncbi:unnamed protein product [Nesidiocoris tenuis]|uniref:Uncharacterized protein n=1 Tax=Nesidiocoris tenuis TaxID=355587 RepID=A0A6H5GH79_9HEMI|nr:unnamed protein product [Nesidiocoris tenuis]